MIQKSVTRLRCPCRNWVDENERRQTPKMSCTTNETRSQVGNLEAFIPRGARKRLTTSSSATAERGAVAAWWSEVKAYKLRKTVARSEDTQARVSSYRDARSSSLQRMVRRYLNSLRTLRKSLVDARTRDGRPNVNLWNTGIARTHRTQERRKAP